MHFIGYSQSNTIHIKAFHAQSVFLELEGHPRQELRLDQSLGVIGWSIRRKDTSTITMLRQREDSHQSFRLVFEPAVSVSMEAWRNLRTKTKLGETALTEQVHIITFTPEDVLLETAAPAPVAEDPRIEELTREVQELREALALQNRIAGAGLSGAQALHTQLTQEYNRITQETEDLDRMNDVLNVNIRNAEAHKKQLEMELGSICDAVDLGDNPGYNLPAFQKLLNRAKKAVENLQTGFSFLLIGRELVLDRRGRAIMTSGHLTAEEDRVPDLPGNDSPESPEEPETNQYPDLYEPEPQASPVA